MRPPVSASPLQSALRVFVYLSVLGIGTAVAQDEPIPALKFPPLSGLDRTASPQNAGDNIKVRARLLSDTSGTAGQLQVKVELAPDWHIYSTTQQDGGPLRTEIDVKPTDNLRVTGPFVADRAPEIEHSGLFPVPEEKYHQQVVWTAPVQFSGDVPLDQVSVTGRINGLICRSGPQGGGECLPLTKSDGSFEARYAGELPELAAPSATPTVPTPTRTGPAPSSAQLLRILSLGLLGGLLLNLMPCVLPVIGLKIMSFVEQSRGDRREAFILNVVYSLGVVAVFVVLAVLAVSLHWKWGEQFTYSSFKVTMIVMVFAMALSFLGVWEIPIPGLVGSGRAGELASQEGVQGAFFKGVFATLLATPCSGPLMGPLFAFAVGKPPYVTYALFLSLGVGMAAPYLLIGAWPALVRWIPRPGAWMETFKELMGFVLLFTVVYLFYTLGNAELFVPVLALLIGVWFACWLVGRAAYSATLIERLLRWGTGVAAATAVGFVAFQLMGPDKHIAWQPFSRSELANAQQAGKTVLVDFTANWCATCKLNQKWVLDTKPVAEAIRDNGIVPLLADWTDRESPTGQQIAAMLESLGHNSIPLLAIFPAAPDSKPILLPDVLTTRVVLDAIQAAGPSQTVAAVPGIARGG